MAASVSVSSGSAGAGGGGVAPSSGFSASPGFSSTTSSTPTQSKPFLSDSGLRADASETLNEALRQMRKSNEEMYDERNRRLRGDAMVAEARMKQMAREHAAVGEWLKRFQPSKPQPRPEPEQRNAPRPRPNW